MKVHEYNEMMAYMLRPQPKREIQVASLMDEYLGDQKEYQKAVDEGFQGTFEEYLRMKSLERKELAIGGGVIEGEDLGSREGFAKVLRSPTGQNLSIEKYPKDILEVIDKTLKGKSNIILKYTLDEINELLKPFDVKIGDSALRKRVSQLKLDDKILRGKIKGVKYKPKTLTDKNLIIKNFVEETNKKILQGYENKDLSKIYDVDLGTDLAKKLGKNVTPTQALGALQNYNNQVDRYGGFLPNLEEGYRVYDREKPQQLIDVENARIKIANDAITEANKGIPFVTKKSILEKAGFPKNMPFTYYADKLIPLETREDKIIKATDSLFKDPAIKAEDLFNPLQKIAKLVSPAERKGKRGEVERIRVDDVTKYVNDNFPDLKPIINKLSNSSVKQKILNNAKKGQIITLGDVEQGLRTGTNLPFTKNIYARMVGHAARHASQVDPKNSLIQMFDENGKVIKNYDDIDSYSNVTFKYRPNTSVDFNKIKEVYGVNRGLVDLPKNSKFVDLTFQAEELPQFKEYFSKVEELEKLKKRDVVHPVTKKIVKFSQLMGETYKTGAGYTKSYERFPYDLDHKMGVATDPFKDLRIISQRLNVGGGQAAFRDPKLLKKMGYLFDKDIDQLFNDEVKLAEDVLLKGRKLRSSYNVAKDFAEKGRTEASKFIPDVDMKSSSGFSKFVENVSRQNNVPINEVEKDLTNVQKVIRKMQGQMNSGIDPKLLVEYLGAEVKDLAAFGQKYGGDVLGKVGTTVAGVDLPIFQVMFGSMYDIEQDSPLWLTIPAAFTDEVANLYGLYDKSEGRFGLGKAKDFGKFVASSFVPRAMRSPIFKAASKVGKAGSLAGPLLEAGAGAYRFEKMKDRRDDAIRQFNIPIEIANKGFEDYIRSTVPQDSLGYLDVDVDKGTAPVPESPGLEGLMRGIKQFGSMVGLADNPYAEKESIYTRGKENPMSLDRALYPNRQNFADGPPDPKRRMILKMLGLIPAGIAGLASLRFGPKKVAKVVETAKGMPEWFGTLVDKVVRKGVDATKRFATKDREEVYEQFIGEQEGVRVYKDLTNGEIRVEYFSPDNMGGDSIDLIYTPKQITEEGVIPAQFRAVELEPRGIRMGPDDYDIEFDGENIADTVEELLSDTSRLEEFATGKKIDADKAKIAKEKKEKVGKMNKSTVEQAEYLESKYGPGDDLYYQDFSDYD